MHLVSFPDLSSRRRCRTRWVSFPDLRCRRQSRTRWVSSPDLRSRRRCHMRLVSFPDLLSRRQYHTQSVYSPDLTHHKRSRMHPASSPDPLHRTQSRMPFPHLPLHASSPVRSSLPETLRFRSIHPGFSVCPSFSFPYQLLLFHFTSPISAAALIPRGTAQHIRPALQEHTAQLVSCSISIIYPVLLQKKYAHKSGIVSPGILVSSW